MDLAGGVPYEVRFAVPSQDSRDVKRGLGLFVSLLVGPDCSLPGNMAKGCRMGSLTLMQQHDGK